MKFIAYLTLFLTSISVDAGKLVISTLLTLLVNGDPEPEKKDEPAPTLVEAVQEMKNDTPLTNKEELDIIADLTEVADANED